MLSLFRKGIVGLRTLGYIGYLWSIVTVSEGRRGNKNIEMHRILCVVTVSEGRRGNKDTGIHRILTECWHCSERISWEYANWDASDTYRLSAVRKRCIIPIQL